MKRFPLCAVVCAALLWVPCSYAAPLGLVPSESGGYGGQPANTWYGSSFAVNSPIYVTALTYYEDSDPDPLENSHLVSLWSEAAPASPLVSATVSPASPILTTGLHAFYYTEITPLLLAPGTYVVAGREGPDDTLFIANSTFTDPEITFLEGRYGDTVNGMPTSPQTLAQMGGNFLFTPVPEPASALPFFIGALVLGLAKARLRFRPSCLGG